MISPLANKGFTSAQDRAVGNLRVGEAVSKPLETITAVIVSLWSAGSLSAEGKETGGLIVLLVMAAGGVDFPDAAKETPNGLLRL
jgi:hypothetical protein